MTEPRRRPQPIHEHRDDDPAWREVADAIAGRPEAYRALRDRETRDELRSGVGPVIGFAWLLVVIALVSILALLVAAPRSAPYPTVGPSVNDARPTGGPSDPPPTGPGSSGEALSGAPHERQAGRAPSAGGRLTTVAGDPPSLVAAVRWAGTATWYCGSGSPCTSGYGPGDLVAAIDTDLGIRKGETVLVRFGKRSVTVRIVDVCACAGERLIDLTTGAFRRLAPLAYGVLPVTIEVVDAGATVPPTETEP